MKNRAFLCAAALSVAFASACDGNVSTPADVPGSNGDAVADAPSTKAQEAKTVRDGPFGFEEGMTLEEITDAVGKEPVSVFESMYAFDTAPRPYGDVDRYVLVVGKDVGLCKIVGESTVKSNRYGTAVRDLFSQIEESLAKKYGKPANKFDRLYPGSIWDEPDDWMMGMLKGERILDAYWGEEGKPVTTKIKSLALSTEATSPEDATVTISYEFPNFDACRAQFKAANEAAL